MLLCSIGTAEARVTATQKCEAAKLRAAGKYELCRLQAEAKAAKRGGTPDFTACTTAYTADWAQAEMKAGGMCPSNGDQATVQAFVSQHTNALGVALAGGMLPACGNGVIDPGELCDQSNLNGQTCLTQGFAAAVLKCGAGCMFDTTGCSASRFVDNGDGTVSDLQTGLMWEKKTYGSCVNLVDGLPVRCASDDDCVDNLGGGQRVCSYDTCPNFVGNTYTWNHSSTPCSNGTLSLDNTSPNGTAFTDFLFRLNVDGNFDPFAFGYGLCISFDGSTPSSGGFAGHCDWRLPTIEELRTIVDPTQGICGGGSGPCIDPVFGPTAAGGYWSATSGDSLGDNFYEIRAFYISGQYVDAYCKTQSFYVRAVRGGL